MKKLFFTLIFINVISITIAQKNIIEDKEWILQKGWFGQDSIVLEKKNIKKHTSYSEQFLFHSNGKLSVEIYNPENFGLCGFGRLAIEKSNWYLYNNDKLMIEIKGQHIAVDKFHYKIIYTININGDTLILRKEKALINVMRQFH